VSITYQLTDGQRALRDVVARFVAEECPPAARRRALDSEHGFDAGLWSRLAGEVGLPALAIPEEYGGAGGSALELAIALEHTGAALVPSPLFATSALAASLLTACEDEPVQADLLPRLATGTTATVAAQFTRDLRPAPDVRAERHRNDWTLHGRVPFVVDGSSAEIILVSAAAPEGLGLFVVSGDASGLTRSPMHTLDLTRRQALLKFRSVPARPITVGGSAESVVTCWIDRVAAALAAEQVGGAQRCLGAAVDYAVTRKQFGQPIGRFQAVKHKCADIYLAVESARSAALHAAQVAAGGSDDLAVIAPIAKATCSDAFVFAAAESLHVHGGIGFTWEHDAHLYYRRARASASMFGTPEAHRELLVSRLGL
jgi:alkylation response protein AidB-like acyl-CoA dehydrogenase